MDDNQRYENLIKRAQRILGIAARMPKQGPYYLESIILDMRLHFNGYAGEHDDMLIATGNWNKIYQYDSTLPTQQRVVSDLPVRVGDLFEKMGIEIEWSDEWTECSECHGLIRVHPDSFSWKPQYKYIDGYVCHDCLAKDPEDYLSSLEDNPDDAHTIDEIDPADHGYVKFNDESYYTGYNGTGPVPSVLSEYMHSRGVYRYLFMVDSNEQFNMSWSVYVHRDEIHLFEDDPGADESDEYKKSLAETAMSSGLSDEIDNIVNSNTTTTHQSSSGAFTLQDLKDAIRKIQESIADTRDNTVESKTETPPSVIKCHTCDKENDRGVTECWWCGNNPEG